MKAIRVTQFGGPEVLTLEETPDPRAPQSGEVLIRVKAAGVNPYDTYMRSGTYGARNPALPFTPGSDAAGVVEAVGAEVNLKPGDRVFTTGTLSGAYAQLALCTAEQVQPLPARIDFVQGAGIYVPYATAHRALFRLAQAQAGETVLIHGASGAVGIAAIQFARAIGMKVIGSAGTEEGLKLIQQLGAQHTVNHRSNEYQKSIVELTQGGGVNVILEMLANINLANDINLLAQHGRVVIVGSRGNVQINPRDIMLREASIHGLFLWGMPAAEAAETHAAIQAGLAAGTLHPVVAAQWPLRAAAEAHRQIMEPGARGKIVLIP